MTWRDDKRRPRRTHDHDHAGVGSAANQVGGLRLGQSPASPTERAHPAANERARNLQPECRRPMDQDHSRAAPRCALGARRRVVRIARWFVAGLGVLALWACGPVYIPVPPPSQITFTAEIVTDSSGTQHTEWITAGGPESKAANGKYFVFDLEQNSGVIAGARDDGSFQSPPLQGQEGDRVLIYYEDALARPSASSCKILSEQRPVAMTCP